MKKYRLRFKKTVYKNGKYVYSFFSKDVYIKEGLSISEIAKYHINKFDSKYLIELDSFNELVIRR